MVKKAKILPAIATLALGIAAFSGANQANAYYVVNNTGVDDVQICHTLNGIVATGTGTYTFTLTSQTNDLDLSKVTLGSGSPAGTALANASASSVEVNMPFQITSTTPTSQTKCAHLNFSNSGVINSNAQWGEKFIDLAETTSDATNFPASTSSSEQLGFIYELNTTGTPNFSPIVHSGTSEYESKFSKKFDASFTSSVVAPKTHITLEKQVRGNYARTDKAFTFKVNITNSVTTATNYYVKVGNSASTPCNFNSDCSFTMTHGQTAIIGLDQNGSDALYEGLYSYKITETPDGYTASWAVYNGSTLGSETSGATYPASGTKTVASGDHIVFFNEKSDTPSGRFLVIFPFVVLAVAAGITIIAVRKTSKNKDEEQA